MWGSEVAGVACAFSNDFTFERRHFPLQPSPLHALMSQEHFTHFFSSPYY